MKFRSLLLALLVSPAAMAAIPGTVELDVVRVKDGDTVEVQDKHGVRFAVRLSSIDAPETHKNARRQGQPFGKVSGKALQAAIHGRKTEFRCFDTDRDNRQICEMFADGESVNRHMVARGFAWAYTGSEGRYLRDKQLVTLQAQAREAGLGLWSQSGATPPWDWRRSCWNEGACTNPER